MASARLHGDLVQRCDVLTDRYGERWTFSFITRDGKVVCQPDRRKGHVPIVLDPEYFAGLAIEEA